MKKILSIISSLILLFSLCSCYTDDSQIRKDFESYEDIDAELTEVAEIDLSSKDKFEIDFSLKEENGKSYINNALICEDPYIVEIDSYNTVIYNNKIYSLGIKHKDSNYPILCVFDDSFNIIESLKLNFYKTPSSYVFLDLYDGLYIQYSSLIYDIKSNQYIHYNHIQKLNMETNTLQEAFDLGNLGIEFSYAFNIKNFDNCSYIIFNKTFYKFSNNELVKLSDERADEFAPLTENEWSFYSFQAIQSSRGLKPNNIYINKVSQHGKEVVFNFSYYGLYYFNSMPELFIINNYLVIPMFFTNKIYHSFKLGFIFMHLETNEIKAYKFPMEIYVFNTFHYFKLSENSLGFTYRKNYNSDKIWNYILTIKE